MSDVPEPSPTHATSGLWSITAHMVVWKALAGAAVAGVAVVTSRQLGPDGRGVFVLLVTLASFTLLVCSLGMNTSCRIHLVDRERRVDSGSFLGLALTLTLLQALVCAALGFALLPVVDVRLTAAELAVFGLFGGSVLAPYLVNAALNAYGFTRAASAVDAAGSVAQLVTVALMLVAGVTTVMPFLIGILAANVFQVVLGLTVLRRLGIGLRPRCSYPQWAMLVRTGLPGIPLDAGGVLTFKLDRYVMGALMSPAAVGIYSVAATAPEMLRMPVLALSQPIFHRLASGSARVADFRRIRRLSLLATAGLAAVTFLVAPFAVRVLFGPEYAGAVTPLRILLLAELGITAFYLDASSLAAGLGRVGDAGFAAFAGLVLVAVADLVLIPLYGIAGAAWASVIAYSGMGLMADLFVRRRSATAERKAMTTVMEPDLGTTTTNPL